MNNDDIKIFLKVVFLILKKIITHLCILKDTSTGFVRHSKIHKTQIKAIGSDIKHNIIHCTELIRNIKKLFIEAVIFNTHDVPRKSIHEIREGFDEKTALSCGPPKNPM